MLSAQLSPLKSSLLRLGTILRDQVADSPFRSKSDLYSANKSCKQKLPAVFPVDLVNTLVENRSIKIVMWDSLSDVFFHSVSGTRCFEKISFGKREFLFGCR